jgi:arginase
MDIELLLVPYDTARRDWRSGAGPQALVEAGLVAHLHAHAHRVVGTHVIEDDPQQPPAEIRTAFELMRRLAVEVRRARDAGRFPVILSGNCGVAAIGALGGLAPVPRSILWFDAHGEANTPETTGSGFLDGMGLAIAWGWCWRTLAATVPGFQPVLPEASVLVGARDLDQLEAARLATSQVRLVPPSAVPHGLAEILASGPLQDTHGYLHLDLDVLDPAQVGRANSLPAPGGLSTSQLTAAVDVIRTRMVLGAVTIASYAPEYDRDREVQNAAFAALAAALPTGP